MPFFCSYVCIKISTMLENASFRKKIADISQSIFYINWKIFTLNLLHKWKIKENIFGKTVYFRERK